MEIHVTRSFNSRVGDTVHGGVITSADGVSVITIPTDDPAHPLELKELDNGEIVVLYDGECYLSVQAKP